MTHTGEGRWPAFRSRVSELEEFDDSKPFCRNLRIILSDLGHVDFFLNGSRSWRVRQPILAGIPNQNKCFLSGGRVPQLIDILQQTTQAANCKLDIEHLEYPIVLKQYVIAATPKKLHDLALEAGIHFIPDIAASLALHLSPISAKVSKAEPMQDLINWEVHSWSFKELAWKKDKKLKKTARMYVNRHGKRRHCLAFRNSLRIMDRYDAIYAAAWRYQHVLANYNQSSQSLLVRCSSPLPEDFSRVACLASGKAALINDGHFVYQNIPPLLAWIILDRLGQPSARRISL